MRRRRTLIVLALAIVSGALAGYSALMLIERERGIIPPTSQTDATQVVVATRDIPVGDRLAEEDVRLVEWPADIVPAGYARSKADVLGRGVAKAIVQDEPVLEAKLADRSERWGIPIAIEEGKRGFPLRVNSIQNVMGYWQPGIRADIVLWMTPPGASEPDAITVMQNVELLGADDMVELDEEGRRVNYTMALLHVTPDEVEDLVMLQEAGDLTMTLRNPLDLAETRPDGGRLTQLLRELRGGNAPVARRTSTAPTPTPTTDASGVVTIIRGNTVVSKFNVGGGGGQ